MRKLSICAALLGLSLHSGFSATVTTTADAGPGSLRAALTTAVPGETITFSVNGAIPLATGELTINKNVRIAGPGPELLAIQRQPDAAPFRIFNVAYTAARISGLAIRNGLCDSANDSGAGIQNYGTLAITDCLLENNVADDRGGGIYNGNGASLWVSNCVFRANGSTGNYGQGGGIYIFGNATILNSSFLNNAVHDRGGGLQVDMFGAAIVNGCTFFGNSAIGNVGQGGGIYNFGTLGMTNCTLTANI